MNDVHGDHHTLATTVGVHIIDMIRPWRRRIVVAVVAAALQLQSEAFTPQHDDAQNVNINSYLLDELISQNKQFVSRHPRIADQIISQPSSIFVRSTEEWFTQYLNLSEADLKRIHTDGQIVEVVSRD